MEYEFYGNVPDYNWRSCRVVRNDDCTIVVIVSDDAPTKTHPSLIYDKPIYEAGSNGKSDESPA